MNKVDKDLVERVTSVTEQIAAELKHMVEDPLLNFTFSNAVSVAGNLHSMMLDMVGETEEQKLEVTMHWMKFHLTRIFPDDDIELMIGTINDALDDAIPAEGLGKGN